MPHRGKLFAVFFKLSATEMKFLLIPSPGILPPRHFTDPLYVGFYLSLTHIHMLFNLPKWTNPVHKHSPVPTMRPGTAPATCLPQSQRTRLPEGDPLDMPASPITSKTSRW